MGVVRCKKQHSNLHLKIKNLRHSESAEGEPQSGERPMYKTRRWDYVQDCQHAARVEGHILQGLNKVSLQIPERTSYVYSPIHHIIYRV